MSGENVTLGFALSGDLLVFLGDSAGKFFVSGKEILRAGVVSVAGLREDVNAGESGVFSGNLLLSGDPAGKVLMSGSEFFRWGVFSVLGAGFVLSGEALVSSGVSSGIVAFSGKLGLRVRDILLSGDRRGVITGERVSPGGVFSGKLSFPGGCEPWAGAGVLGKVPADGGASLPLFSPSPLPPGRTSPPPPASSPTLTPSSAGRGVPA